jgi:SAM-dependent methyltransferase
MGLGKPALRFLAREHRRRPLAGDVLTLGRQCVYAAFEDARDILVSEGIQPATLAQGRDTATNIPAWRGTPKERYTSDVAFFEMLGVTSVRAMDCSDFEGAEILWDLNTPVPQELTGRFDLIVDGGTIEHIFDIRQAFMNIGRLLCPGGRIVHFTPANNYVNHGFYQCSPTLFSDYYSTNGFADVRTFVAEETLRRDELAMLDVYQVDPDHQPLLMMSKKPLQVIVVAEKMESSSVERLPQQSIYNEVGQRDVGAERDDRCAASLSDTLRRIVPTPMKTFLARYVIPGLHPHRKPWRLKRWARLK